MCYSLPLWAGVCYSSMSSTTGKWLQQSIQHTQFETSSGKSFQAIVGKGICERWENHYVCREMKPTCRCSCHRPKFFSPKDDTRVQSGMEVLAIEKQRPKLKCMIMTLRNGRRGVWVSHGETQQWMTCVSVTQTVWVRTRKKLRRTTTFK